MIKNTIFLLVLCATFSCKIVKHEDCYEYVSKRSDSEHYFKSVSFKSDSMFFIKSIHMSSGTYIYKGKYQKKMNRIKAELLSDFRCNFNDSVFLFKSNEEMNKATQDTVIISINLFDHCTGYEVPYTGVQVNNLKNNSFENYYTDSNGSVVLSFNKNEVLKNRYIWIEHMGMKSDGFKMSLAGCENKTVCIYLGTSKHSHLYVEPFYKIRGKFRDDYVIINGVKYYKCKNIEK